MGPLRYSKRCRKMDSCRCRRRTRILGAVLLGFLISASVSAFGSGMESAVSQSKPADRFAAWFGPKLRSVLSESSGIVAERFPVKLAIAQAGIETGWGTHKPALKRNNFFGLTRADGSHMRFENVEDSIRTYVKSLTGNSAYSDLRKKLEKTDHPEKLAEELDVYAKDPDYVQKLKSALRSIRIPVLTANTAREGGAGIPKPAQVPIEICVAESTCSGVFDCETPPLRLDHALSLL